VSCFTYSPAPAQLSAQLCGVSPALHAAAPPSAGARLLMALTTRDGRRPSQPAPGSRHREYAAAAEQRPSDPESGRESCCTASVTTGDGFGMAVDSLRRNSLMSRAREDATSLGVPHVGRWTRLRVRSPCARAEMVAARWRNLPGLRHRLATIAVGACARARRS
jgi:hypothetical protein